MKDDRLKKNNSAGNRESRAEQDDRRVSADDALMSSDERRKMFRNEWIQEALPTPPSIPGYHLCWLSTTNAYDPIHKRMRLGYEPVKAEELPGFDTYKVKAGEHTGFVACNEMVLYKMPDDIYQSLMAEVHHYAPRDEADKIRVQVQELQSVRDSNGKRLGIVEGDGMNQLDKHVAVPTFE
jgi:hypothetical protein